jgi:hypothetical protein
MKKHNVVPTADLCPKEMARKAKERADRTYGRTPAQRADRVEAIKHAIDVSRRGYR